MVRNIITAKGAFSSLSISINDETVGKLALIDPDNNPLAKIDKDMKKLLVRFEKEYTKLVHQSKEEK